jgi:hypothetical protein
MIRFGSRPYSLRLAGLYLALGLVLAAAIGGLIVTARTAPAPRQPDWSSWSPTEGSDATMVAQITNHVANDYGPGSQIVAAIPGPPDVTAGTNEKKIAAIGILRTAHSSTFSRILATTNTYQVELCGLDPACALTPAQASPTDLRLLRSEALEIALYTFKFVPGIDAMLVYMPPSSTKSPPRLPYLEKNKLENALSQPLKNTLATTALSTDPSRAATINGLTLPAQFAYTLQSQSDGTEALILFPTA